MLKRFAQAVGTALKVSKPKSAAALSRPSITMEPSIHTTLRGAFASNEMKKYDDITSAHHDLKDAVRELSKGETMPVVASSAENLHSWDTQAMDTLTVPQAEELARVFFEGTNGFPEDKTRSLALWKYAADKGSVEAKYSRALCLKDGVGIAQDSELARDELLALAEQQQYNLAHVSQLVDGLPD
jgi:TPR repeat protein